MAKQLNVDMNFRANTAQAQQSIMALQAQLTKLGYSNNLKMNTAGIDKASAAARELQTHLNRAINADTGKLDLGKFNASLTSANKSLSALTSDLATGGELGQKAFTNITRAIADAEQPVITLNKQMSTLWTTMKNTLRWQISSSVLNQLMTSVSTAYSYVQSLDKSLNDIRIVSGLSADNMADFAERANEAAKSLSTTTTKYTDAALIFYQQGLSDSEVEERTNATIKMANVTGEAVDDVSSYMTAVWNNFNKDGTESVEHFADVMTKLGADTAASTEEIAGGLEKFAGVCDTIGLSFDYATSAITTIVDRTRQSEDVVGTALKTIFSRVQGLQLGETLDDGTTLNQYSTALAKIGVGIKTLDGELRPMDDILDDIGEKWEDLNDAEKAAVAQKVAGIRQYNQFIALFDNWDFMKQNLATAAEADGTLNEQAEIYAESWEAARNRVKAAAQEIYSALLDKDFFISFDDVLADSLTGIADFIEQIGGIKSILIGVGTVFMALIKDKITPGIQAIKQNLMIVTGSMDKVYADIQNKNTQIVEKEIASGNYTKLQETELRNTAALSTAKQKLALAARHLSAEEEMAANTAIEGFKYQQEEITETAQKIENLQKIAEESNKTFEKSTSKTNLSALDTLERQMSLKKNTSIKDQNKTSIAAAYGAGADKMTNLKSSLQKSTTEDYSAQKQMYDTYVQGILAGDQKIVNSKHSVQEVYKETSNTLSSFATNLEKNMGKYKDGVPSYFTDFGKSYTTLENTLKASLKSFPQAIMEIDEVQAAQKKLTTAFNAPMGVSGKNTKAIIASYKDLLNVIENVQLNGEELGKVLEQTGNLGAGSLDKLIENYKKLQEEEEKATQQADSMNKAIEDFNPQHVITGGEAFGSLMQAAGSASMAIFSVKSLIDSIKDEDSSGIERAASILMSISMLGPSILSVASAAPVAIKYIKQLILNFQAANTLSKAYGVQNLKNATQTISSLSLEEAARVAHTAVVKAQSQSMGVLSDEYKEQIAYEALLNQGLSEELAKRLALSVVNDADGGIDDAAGVTKYLETLKGQNLNLLKILPTLGLIAVAIGAIVAVAFLWYQYTHKARKEYEESTKTLSAVKSAYEEVASSIDTVNNTLDDLSDKYKNLKELTYGTSEWRTALANVNSEVQDIIDKYELIQGDDWYRDDKGALHLTETGKTKVSTENERQKQSAQIAYESAKDYNAQAKVAASIEEVQYESEYTGRFASGYTGGNKKGGKSTYTRSNLDQEAIQAIVSAIATDKQIVDAEGLTEEWVKQNSNLSSANQQIVNSNDRLKEKLVELANAVQDNTEAQIQRNANLLASDESFSKAVDKNIDEDYRASIYEIAGEDLNNEVERRVAERAANPTGEGNYVTAEDRENYYKDLGYGKSSDGKYYKQNDDGSLDTTSEMSEEMQSDDEIFRWKAKTEAIEEADKKVKTYYVDIVENSKKVWSAIDNTKSIKSALKSAGKELDTFVKDHREDFETIFIDPQADNEIKEAFKNLDDGELADFIKNNESLFKEAMGGDAEAVEGLRTKLQEVMATDWREELAQSIGENGTVELETKAEVNGEIQEIELSKEAYQTTAGEVSNLLDNLDAAIDPLTIGASLDTTEVRAALSDLVAKTGMSADQITEYLSLNGWEGVTLVPKYEEVPVLFGSKALGTAAQALGFDVKTKKVFSGWSVLGGTKSDTGNDIASITDDSNSGDDVDTSTGGSGSKKTSSAKKVDKKVVRYHNIDDTLEDINQKLEKAADLEDRLFGNARITQMDKQIKAYKEEAAALEKRNKIAKNYLKYDKKQATKSINKFNKLTGAKVSDVKYDSDNDILNYNAILSAAKKAADKWYKKAKANPEDDAIQDKYDKIKEYYENIEEKLKQVEDTRDQIVENEEKRLEALRNAQDKYFDELTYKVEVKLDINERDLELLERSYDKIADLTYKRAEAIKILFKTEKDAEGKDVLTSDSRFGVAAKQLGIYTDEYNELKKAYSAGNISQEQFVEGLEDVYEGALDAADTLQDLDEQMLEYYSDTLSSGAEELDKYAERIDNVVSGLNHYLTVMDLIGKNKSYAQINKITSTLTKTAKNQYNTATQTYKMYLDQQTQAKQAMDDYLKKHTELATYEQQMNDAGYQALLKNYDAITEYVDDAYEDQLSSAEEYLEALNTEYTNFFDQLKNNYLDTLSSTMDFDRLNNSLQNVKTQWEEVLTPVNQAYELTKLIRQAEQDMADTDSAYAKQQYQEYIDSTKALEDKTELSNYELEIQQAKYKQLQAQIALEEAQNAKNMVRLSRDSEGNYGYVYTADQDSIADAQQAKDDADNDLYNIALRGRDEYYEKLLQLESDYQDAIAEAGETYKDDTEKLNEALAEIEAEYYNIRQTYLYNYNLAAITDDRAKRDAYVANYEDVIKKDNEWKATSTENINAIKEKQQEYKDSTEEVYNALGLSVGEFTSTIENLDEKQQSLTTTVQTKVIPALEDEETQVLNTATAYAQYRTEVEKTIKQLEDLAKVADTTISQVGGYTEEGEEESAYNTFINNLAVKRGLYTSKDSKGIVHFSKTDQDTADKYAKNANVSSETEKWNNSVAKNMVDKNGWFAYDSEGKIHFTTKTDTKEAKAYLAKLMGMKESEFTMNKFDTGGYTGSWGNSGKLALLHEKELVLNADDTKNFLAGINILRDVVKSIDLQAMCASNSGMRAAGVSTSNQTLAQEVNITAEFPNATDHSEIEQAFDTLINRAAQYVNRK